MWDDYCDKHKDHPVLYITYLTILRTKILDFLVPQLTNVKNVWHISEFVVVDQNEEFETSEDCIATETDRQLTAQPLTAQETAFNPEAAQQNETAKGSPKHNKQTCTICTKFDDHKKKYTVATIEYQQKIPTGYEYFTADMQNVLVLPMLTRKEHLLFSRLVTFNETFAAKSENSKDYCVVTVHFWT